MRGYKAYNNNKANREDGDHDAPDTTTEEVTEKCNALSTDGGFLSTMGNLLG